MCIKGREMFLSSRTVPLLFQNFIECFVNLHRSANGTTRHSSPYAVNFRPGIFSPLLNRVARESGNVGMLL